MRRGVLDDHGQSRQQTQEVIGVPLPSPIEHDGDVISGRLVQATGPTGFGQGIQR
jgi:hypothetical protein